MHRPETKGNFHICLKIPNLLLIIRCPLVAELQHVIVGDTKTLYVFTKKKNCNTKLSIKMQKTTHLLEGYVVKITFAYHFSNDQHMSCSD